MLVSAIPKYSASRRIALNSANAFDKFWLIYRIRVSNNSNNNKNTLLAGRTAKATAIEKVSKSFAIIKAVPWQSFPVGLTLIGLIIIYVHLLEAKLFHYLSLCPCGNRLIIDSDVLRQLSAGTHYFFVLFYSFSPHYLPILLLEHQASTHSDNHFKTTTTFFIF